jgi:hypothetical protein
VLLSERVMTAALILRDLERLLAGMSPRTRRPIRFLEPDDSKARPTGEGGKSNTREDSSLGPSAP